MFEFVKYLKAKELDGTLDKKEYKKILTTYSMNHWWISYAQGKEQNVFPYDKMLDALDKNVKPNQTFDEFIKTLTSTEQKILGDRLKSEHPITVHNPIFVMFQLLKNTEKKNNKAINLVKENFEEFMDNYSQNEENDIYYNTLISSSPEGKTKYGILPDSIKDHYVLDYAVESNQLMVDMGKAKAELINQKNSASTTTSVNNNTNTVTVVENPNPTGWSSKFLVNVQGNQFELNIPLETSKLPTGADAAQQISAAQEFISDKVSAILHNYLGGSENNYRLDTSNPNQIILLFEDVDGPDPEYDINISDAIQKEFVFAKKNGKLKVSLNKGIISEAIDDDVDNNQFNCKFA